jgi:hypothetical protein
MPWEDDVEERDAGLKGGDEMMVLVGHDGKGSSFEVVESQWEVTV